MGGQPEPRQSPKRELRLQEDQRRRLHVPSFQCFGADHIRLRWPRRRFGDPGHNSVDAREAVENSDVERRRVGLLHQRHLLFPGRPNRVLGLRAGRCRQRAGGA